MSIQLRPSGSPESLFYPIDGLGHPFDDAQIGYPRPFPFDDSHLIAGIFNPGPGQLQVEFIAVAPSKA
jgi:hypothetical protein